MTTAHITDERLAEIEAGLEGVTPGAWREGVDGNLRLYGPDASGPDSGLIALFVRRRDLSHIACCDPDTIRAIIAWARAAEAERDALRVSNDELAKALAIGLTYAQEAADDHVGPTGEFPRGKLDVTDEGQLNIGLAADAPNGVVRIEFGKEIAWLAFWPDEAETLAKAILAKASEVRAVRKPS